MSQVPAKGVCVGFTSDEDTLLMKYIATYNPTKKYRSRNALYKRLVENVDNKWNWSRMHSWQSWQTRYRNHMEEFNRRIRKYQKKHGINLGKTHETPAIGPSNQARSFPPYQGPSKAVSDVPPPSPKPPNMFNSVSLTSRSDTLPILSSQVNSPVRTLPPLSSQLPPSSQPLASFLQQVVTPKPPKRVLKHKSVSPTFCSLSPTHDCSAPLKIAILPKVVKGHFITALTDWLGHVPLGQVPVMAKPAAGPLELTTATRETAGGYDLPRMDLRILPVSTYRILCSRASSSASHLPRRHSLTVHSTSSAIPANLSSYLIMSGSTTPSIPLTFIMPVNLRLSASVGFKSLLSGIATTHRYSPDVVLEVYKCVESLAETEKCVRGMLHVPEGWIEAALERREREAHRAMRASIDRENERENRKSDDSDNEPPHSSCHQPSSQQTVLERCLPNRLRVRHEPELSDIHCTRSASPPWNMDEGMTPLSGNWEVHQMLERRLGKQGMRKRVVQSLQ
ncbi:hypothetical protein C8R48DRAFT_675750 [Suillus tomentosus]|nr:hypothetical protein C8R48DRAFT_675750 [Suillus tomentosus]